MMRMEQLTAQFTDYSVLANNRNPYANCSSILYRQYDVKNISSTKRKEIIECLARDWLTRSRRLKLLIENYNIPLLTYEQFCQCPSSILEVLQLPRGVSESINLDAEVKVKDYKVQSISNQNERQINNLSDVDLENISQILSTESQLLEFFEYKVL